MGLTVGELKEEEPWRQVMPWVRSLTARNIGQIWIHHTGIEKTRGYGTTTREWEMDLVMLLTKVEHPETDVSFTIEFTKAREREPETGEEYNTVKVALINDEWSYHGAKKATVQTKPLSAVERSFFDAFMNVAAGSTEMIDGRRAVSNQAWADEAKLKGLINPDKKPASARAMIYDYKKKLIAKGWIGGNSRHGWVI
jgi:hypothetical protein